MTEELKKMQSAFYRKGIILFGIYIVLLIPSLYFLSMFPRFVGNEKTGVLLLAFGVISLIFFFIHKYIEQLFCNNVKDKVLENYVDNVAWGDNFHGISYSNSSEKNLFQKTDLDNLKLFNPKSDFFVSRDYINVYDKYDQSIMAVDIETNRNELVTDEKGSRTVKKSIFKGTIFKAYHSSNFEGETYLIAKTSFGQIFNLKNFLLPAVEVDSSIYGLASVHLESPVFMKNFNVFTSSQLGARLALQTDIMDAINELVTLVGKPVYVSFIGGEINFAVTDGDLFRVKPYANLSKGASMLDIEKEFELIAKITNRLKLNQKKF
jgi:hypothetical protein